MTGGDLLTRTRAVALRVIRVTDALPRTRPADVVGRQLLRSATSAAANYRAAKRGRSTAEVVAKLSIVEEEADGTVFGLEMLADSGLVQPDLIADLRAGADEIVAMVVASIRTARGPRPK